MVKLEGKKVKRLTIWDGGSTATGTKLFHVLNQGILYQDLRFIKIAKKLSRCESIFCKKNVKRYLSLNIKIFQIAGLLPWFGTWEREHAYKAKP